MQRKNWRRDQQRAATHLRNPSQTRHMCTSWSIVSGQRKVGISKLVNSRNRPFFPAAPTARRCQYQERMPQCIKREPNWQVFQCCSTWDSGTETGRPIQQSTSLHAVLSFLLILERLERARCATARETGVSKLDGHAAVPLARSSLLFTVDEKRKGLRAV